MVESLTKSRKHKWQLQGGGCWKTNMRILKSVIPLVLLVLVTAQHAEDGNASKQLQHDTKQQPPPKLLPNEQVNSDKKVEKTVLQEKNHNVTSKVAGSNNNKTSNSSLSITHTTHSPIQVCLNIYFFIIKVRSRTIIVCYSLHMFQGTIDTWFYFLSNNFYMLLSFAALSKGFDVKHRCYSTR